MNCSFRLLLLALICFGNSKPYCGFIDRFESQYVKESALRQQDSLFFIPTVMNLVDNNKYRSSSISDRRSSFFKRLSQNKTILCYPRALEIDSQRLYINPRGDMDYREHKREPVYMFKQDSDNLHPFIKKRFQALIDYIKTEKPSFVFSIADATYEPEFDILWSIRDSTLYVLRMSTSDATLEEYEAAFYIKNIAPDTFFSSALRLQMLNKTE